MYVETKSIISSNVVGFVWLPVGVDESLAPAEVLLRDHVAAQPLLVRPNPRRLFSVVAPDALAHVEGRQAVSFPERNRGDDTHRYIGY